MSDDCDYGVDHLGRLMTVTTELTAMAHGV